MRCQGCRAELTQGDVAAVDGAEFPYQEIDERERSYLSRLEAKRPDYLNAGWLLMTKGLCVQCHAIGANKPTGG